MPSEPMAGAELSPQQALDPGSEYDLVRIFRLNSSIQCMRYEFRLILSDRSIKTPSIVKPDIPAYWKISIAYDHEG